MFVKRACLKIRRKILKLIQHYIQLINFKQEKYFFFSKFIPAQNFKFLYESTRLREPTRPVGILFLRRVKTIHPSLPFYLLTRVVSSFPIPLDSKNPRDHSLVPILSGFINGSKKNRCSPREKGCRAGNSGEKNQKKK